MIRQWEVENEKVGDTKNRPHREAQGQSADIFTSLVTWPSGLFGASRNQRPKGPYRRRGPGPARLDIGRHHSALAVLARQHAGRTVEGRASRARRPEQHAVLCVRKT